MHSPQSDGSRHPGKHSPQSDGSRHCLGGMVIKNCVAALDTSLPCFLPVFHRIPHVFPCFLRAVLSRPMSAAKKEKKKLLQTACHICNKKGCQAACLLCNVAFHTRCDPHDPCPSAPEFAGINFGIQPRLAPCEGQCGSEHAKTGDCGCTDEVCGCGYRFNAVPEFFQRTKHFTSRQHQAWLQPAPPQGCANRHHQFCGGR